MKPIRQAGVEIIKVSGRRDVSALGKHHDRSVPPENADPARRHLNKAKFDADPDEPDFARKVDEILRNHKIDPTKTRANNVLLVDVLVSLSVELEAELTAAESEQWEDLTTDDYARKEYGDRLVYVWLHRDETAPHLHIGFVPVFGGKLRAGDKLDRAFFAEAHTKVAKALKPLGFQRAAGRTNASHIDTAQWRALMKAPVKPIVLVPEAFPLPPMLLLTREAREEFRAEFLQTVMKELDRQGFSRIQEQAKLMELFREQAERYQRSAANLAQLVQKSTGEQDAARDLNEAFRNEQCAIRNEIEAERDELRAGTQDRIDLEAVSDLFGFKPQREGPNRIVNLPSGETIEIHGDEFCLKKAKYRGRGSVALARTFDGGWPLDAIFRVLAGAFGDLAAQGAMRVYLASCVSKDGISFPLPIGDANRLPDARHKLHVATGLGASEILRRTEELGIFATRDGSLVFPMADSSATTVGYALWGSDGDPDYGRTVAPVDAFFRIASRKLEPKTTIVSRNPVECLSATRLYPSGQFEHLCGGPGRIPWTMIAETCRRGRDIKFSGYALDSVEWQDVINGFAERFQKRPVRLGENGSRFASGYEKRTHSAETNSRGADELER